MKFDTVSPIADALESTLEAFRAGDFDRAESEADKALALDFEHAGVQAALKCAVFWKDRMARASSFPAPEARGDFLIKEWQGFVKRFLVHLDDPFEAGLEGLKWSVYQKAAEAFLEQVPFEEPGRQSALQVKAAKAWKANGSFDKALGILDEILQAKPDDAGALAEMADCHEAVGDTQRARLFFREAFYLDAQAVDVEGLRSPVVRDLAGALADEGLSAAELKEWLPVHAVVRGVFTVKRDLKPLELGQLRQGINALKAELRDGAGNRGFTLPRLLYRYFWLIDHFISVKEDRSKIEDVLLNIKLLDAKIYELYTH